MNEELLKKWNEELAALVAKKNQTKMDKIRIKEIEKKLQNKKDNIINEAGGVFAQKQITVFNVNELTLNPKQPRKWFDERAIADLSESIKRYGQLEPIVVADIAGKKYLVSGERRLRAVKLLGQNRIDGVINDSIRTLDDLYLFAIAENADRENLNCGEVSQIVKNLREENNFTFEKIGQLLNISKTAVFRHYQISKLAPELLDIVILKNINKPNVLEEISKIDDIDEQKRYIELALTTEISLSDVIKRKLSRSKSVAKEKKPIRFTTIGEGVVHISNELLSLEKNIDNLSKRDFNNYINRLVSEIKEFKKLKNAHSLREQNN